MRLYACTTVSLGGVRPWVHEFVGACVHECVTMGMIVEHVCVSVCVRIGKCCCNFVITNLC